MELTVPYNMRLIGGKDGSRPSAGDILGSNGTGWSIFADSETSSDVNLLIAPPLWTDIDTNFEVS